MKIAQISSVYLSIPPKTHGGTERIVYHLCRQLSRRGHQVELFSSGDSRVDCPLHSALTTGKRPIIQKPCFSDQRAIDSARRIRESGPDPSRVGGAFFRLASFARAAGTLLRS